MNIRKIGRSTVFTYDLGDWSLSLHLIEGEQTNYLIDTGLGSGCVEPILKHLEHSQKPLVVINTHHHWDHIWGNAAYPFSKIISHKLCKQLLEENWEEMLKTNGKYKMGKAGLRAPDCLFEDELRLPEGIWLFHTPGHTSDSISVYDEVDKVLNVGDNIGDSLDDILPSIYTSTEEYRASVLSYKELDVKQCVSGHCGVCESVVFDKILEALEEQ